MSDGSDEENEYEYNNSDETDDDDNSARDALNGRGSLYCCLSCGIPFAYPDDSYISSSRTVQDIIHFTHVLRHCMRKDDRSKASTTQWQLNKAHYIHRQYSFFFFIFIFFFP